MWKWLSHMHFGIPQNSLLYAIKPKLTASKFKVAHLLKIINDNPEYDRHCCHMGIFPLYSEILNSFNCIFIMPPFEEEGYIVLLMSTSTWPILMSKVKDIVTMNVNMVSDKVLIIPNNVSQGPGKGGISCCVFIILSTALSILFYRKWFHLQLMQQFI